MPHRARSILLPLRSTPREGCQHRRKCRCTIEDDVRRCRLFAATTLAHIPHSVAQHRWYWPNLRCDTWRVLRPCGLSVDHAGRYLYGCYARLSVGCYLAAQRGSKPPQDHWQVSRQGYAPPRISDDSAAYDSRRWRIHRHTRQGANEYVGDTISGVGRLDHRLLLYRNGATRRQDYR